MKDSCYFFNDVQDMNAHIPTCDFFSELGFCPCSDPNFDCPFYVHVHQVRSLIVKYVFSRVYPNVKL